LLPAESKQCTPPHSHAAAIFEGLQRCARCAWPAWRLYAPAGPARRCAWPRPRSWMQAQLQTSRPRPQAPGGAHPLPSRFRLSLLSSRPRRSRWLVRALRRAQTLSPWTATIRLRAHSRPKRRPSPSSRSRMRESFSVSCKEVQVSGEGSCGAATLCSSLGKLGTSQTESRRARVEQSRAEVWREESGVSQRHNVARWRTGRRQRPDDAIYQVTCES
jgi:hypothetical protein